MGFCLPLRLEFCEGRGIPKIGGAVRSDSGKRCAVSGKGQAAEPGSFSGQTTAEAIPRWRPALQSPRETALRWPG